MKQWGKGSGNLCCRNGNRVRWRISQYSGASITPSKIQIPVAPFLLMPAQTCTSMGCFGRGFE